MFAFRTRPVLYLLLFLLPASSSFAVIRYVNINNPTPGAGTSWATAYNDLNAAIAASAFPGHYGDEIWVAQGTYKPTTTTNRAATFLCTFGYDIYGGFNGTETARTQRDPKTYITILSGDIGVPGNASDNSYHVVTLQGFQGGRFFDGFTIRDGNANAGYPGSTAPQPDNSGGGVLELALAGDNSRADLTNDLITNNFAVYGGGFCSYGDGTSAQSFFGISSLVFDNNTAVFGGAVAAVAMNGDWGGPSIKNCIFINNNSITAQGSVFAALVDNPYTGGVNNTIDNCTLYNNGASVFYNQPVGTAVSRIDIMNVIVWKSGAPYTSVTSGPAISFSECDVYLATALTGSGNLDADPLFVNAAGNDFHLTPCSPCIDKGFTTWTLAVDYEGNARPQGAETDIGAYEATVIGPVSAAPTIAGVSYCQNATATALTATGTNLLWYTAVSGGTGSSTAPVPSTATAGVTNFYVTQTLAGNCESVRTPLPVTIRPLPAVPTAASPTYCQYATATALSATGSAKLWYTVATGGIGSGTAPVPSTATAGTTTWYVTQTVSCESARTPVIVTVNPAAAAPTATSPNYCKNATATALTATGSNLLWYTVATGGSGSSTAPVPSTASVGTATWYVTQTPAGSCESARTPVTVTVSNASAAPTGISPTYCQNVTATALTATGSNLLWYTVATGGSGISTAPVPSTTSVGTTTWYVTQTPASSCESARTPVTVTVSNASAAPTGTSPAYCQNVTATALTATGSNLLWYTVATGGTGSSTAPVPSTTTTGTTTWYVTQTPAAGCESNRTPVAVTINTPPAAPATAPVNYCKNAAAVALTATGSNLLWYTVAAGGSGTATAPTPATTASGTTTYYVSQTIGCESPRNAIVVTVGTQPAAPAATSAVYCQNDAAVALTATGANLLWYTTATGGTGVNVAPTPATTASGTTTYYVSQTIGCESPRTVVTVTVDPNPTASFTGSPACPGAASTISAAGMAVAPGSYTWDFGNPASVSGSGGGPYRVVWNTSGDHAITLITSTGGCQSQATHNVTVYALPAVSISPITAQLCAGGGVTLNATGASTYQWSPATNLSNAAISNPVAVLKSDILYTVTGTDNNGCADTAQIELKPGLTCLGYNIPDAFTPNSDGHNDLFRVRTGDVPKSFRMMIFNRYGGKVFESRDVQTGWDGTMGGSAAMAGAYVYAIVIKTSAGITIEKKGTVMLLR